MGVEGAANAKRLGLSPCGADVRTAVLWLLIRVESVEGQKLAINGALSPFASLKTPCFRSTASFAVRSTDGDPVWSMPKQGCRGFEFLAVVAVEAGVFHSDHSDHSDSGLIEL